MIATMTRIVATILALLIPTEIPAQIVANADGWEIGRTVVLGMTGDYWALKRSRTSLDDYDETKPFLKPKVSIICTQLALPPSGRGVIREPALEFTWDTPRPTPGIRKALNNATRWKIGTFDGALEIGDVKVTYPVVVQEISPALIRATVTIVGRRFVEEWAETLFNTKAVPIALDGVSYDFDFSGILTAAKFISNHCK